MHYLWKFKYGATAKDTSARWRILCIDFPAFRAAQSFDSRLRLWDDSRTGLTSFSLSLRSRAAPRRGDDALIRRAIDFVVTSHEVNAPSQWRGGFQGRGDQATPVSRCIRTRSSCKVGLHTITYFHTTVLNELYTFQVSVQ